MAHSSLHFTVGMAVGSAFTLPALLNAWRKGAQLSSRFRNWFIAAYAAGAFATVPGILRRLGAPDAVCDGWWMNVFLFYPWINTLKPGAMTMGPMLLGAFLGFQYLLLVAALVWRLRHSEQDASMS